MFDPISGNWYIDFSLAKAKSSVVYSGGAGAHCNRWLSHWISPHSHSMSAIWSLMVSPFRRGRFCFSATPVLNLFHVFHVIHGWFPPDSKCSAGGAGVSAYSTSLHFRSLSCSHRFGVVIELAIKRLRDLNVLWVPE